MSEQERAQAIIYGLALGDALGWPIEFLRMEKIKTIYGEAGIQEPPDPALYTDDTQTSIAIAGALVEAGQADIDSLMGAVTRHLVAWNNSPENTRAPGHTVTEAMRTLEAGVSWRESGAPHARGNGSAIRVAPIGYFYQHDPARLREVAHATSLMTHSHPAAVASSVAAAYLVKLALDGVPPEQYVSRTLEFTAGMSEELHEVLSHVEEVTDWTDELAAITNVGGGWVAVEAVAMAVYCALRYPNDFVGAVCRAVNIPGDSDSVGCVTGGLVAARTGLDAIPRGWIDRLEHRNDLTGLANRLAARKESLTSGPAGGE